MVGIKLEEDQCALVAQVKENDVGKKFGGCVESSNKQNFKFYQCGKFRHLKRSCWMKLKESNLVKSKISTEDDE